MGGGTDPDPDSPESLYKAGALNSGSFSNGNLAIGQSDLASGGSTAISVDIVDKSNQLAFGVNASVGFSSACLSRGLSQVSAAQTTTTTGSLTATYTAKGCAGDDLVTAFVTIDGATVTAKGTISVQPAELGGLEFISATPATIGMTGSPLPTESAVLFKLTDAGGVPLPNRTVNFSLNTSVGGALLAPTSAVSGADGIVRTVVRAGSAHTSVRVRASTTSPSNGVTISSQSEQLVITTGLPDQDSFSLSADRFAIDGYCEGEPATLTIRAADRYNNPAPSGTAVAFTAEGGKINASCITGNENNPLVEAGLCSVLFSVQEPRPTDGRVTVLASAIGEESFVDSNGNGFRDNGEPFTDLAEAFVDFDEDDVRDAVEPILDFNNDGLYTPANGVFDGYVCSQPGQNCVSGTANIRESAIVVLSETRVPPVVTAQTGVVMGGISTTVSTTVPISLRITDINDNSLPNGTTFALSTSAGTVVAPATVGPFTTISGDVVNFSLTAPDAPATGVVTLTIKIPSECGEKTYTRTYTLSVT